MAYSALMAAQPIIGLDQELWDGIQKYLENYVLLEDHDDVVITYTPDSREPAAWVALAVEARGNSFDILPMQPLKDSGFPGRLKKIVPPRRDKPGRLVLLMFERDTMSHNKVIKQVLAEYPSDKYNVVRAINSGRDLFVTGMESAPALLSALNTTLLERCRTARELKIETEAGTDLSITLDNSRFRWISNRGVGAPGKFLIVPSGEVATFPAAISGRLVADFALNLNTYFEGDVRLTSCPVTVDIKDNKMVHFQCDNKEIFDYLGKSFARENATIVGELGLGTNPAIREPVPENSHLNERVQGIHLGFGQHNQTVEAAGYFCDIHIDLCARGGLIWIDRSTVPIDLARLTPSLNPHPELINSEDVFSDDPEDDCCGLLS